ncbi:CsgG/HfaB family protein [Verrucomicrobiota bacterium]
MRATVCGLMVSLLICVACGTAGAQGVPAAAAAGNLRYSISVSKFKNEAGWHGRWNVGDGFTTIMTDALQESARFIVLGDAEMRGEAMAEQDFAASGRTAQGKKAPKIGRMTPAQLLVRGSITHVQENTSGRSGGLGFKGIRIGGAKGSAEVNITIYLVDTETGQVKASTKVVGKSTKKGLSLGYSGSALGGLTGDLAGFENDNVGKACADAVAQGVQFLVGQLESVPWQASIVLAKADKIVLNRGTREGVSTGMRFTVGGVEELVDEDTGEVLDSDMTTVATIEVTQVKEKVAYCKALEGGDDIEKGMAAFPCE